MAQSTTSGTRSRAQSPSFSHNTQSFSHPPTALPRSPYHARPRVDCSAGVPLSILHLSCLITTIGSPSTIVNRPSCERELVRV